MHENIGLTWRSRLIECIEQQQHARSPFTVAEKRVLVLTALLEICHQRCALRDVTQAHEDDTVEVFREKRLLLTCPQQCQSVQQQRLTAARFCLQKIQITAM